ncbi:MAG: methyltransferase domain-containing protein [Gammaproteobacteria bacterium]|nr:methyltransferase domain-containing protein [Gammaproteobacteria bacterium]
MSLKHSYTFLSPIYDLLVKPAFHDVRQKYLQQYHPEKEDTVLIVGIGTGLDIPHLPENPRYIGVDLTPAMLNYAKQYSAQRSDIVLHCGNAMRLPYAESRFDTIIMHLILAVVPNPQMALDEAARVLKPGGQILILDKFLRPGQFAPVRRLISFLSRHLATRTDVTFEPLLAQRPDLKLLHDEAAMASGWFRYIKLEKTE